MHEARYLRLDSSKSKSALGWLPVLEPDETFGGTANWYRGYLNDEPAQDLMRMQISAYEDLIQRRLH